MIDWETKYHALLKKLEGLDSNIKIYPAAVRGMGEESDYKQRDGFKNGWNAAILNYGEKFAEIVHDAQDEISDDLNLLMSADLGWLQEDGSLEINLNDTWYWACSDCEVVSPQEMKAVARLFNKYGFAGILYWVYKKRNDEYTQFEDYNRFIDFVAKEEEIIRKIPGSTKRAQYKCQYTLGSKPRKTSWWRFWNK
jgi:hypothetical protein